MPNAYPNLVEDLNKYLVILRDRKVTEFSEEAARTLVAVTYSKHKLCPYLMTDNDRNSLEAASEHLHCPEDFLPLKDWLLALRIEDCSLELLSILHSKGIVYLSTILFYHSSEVNSISKALIQCIFSSYPKDQDRINNVVFIVLSSLINVGSYSLRALYDITASLLESFVSLVVEKVNSNNVLKINFLEELRSRDGVVRRQLKLFAVSFLNCFITFPSSSAGLSAALANHYKEWSSSSLSPSAHLLFTEISTLISSEDIVKEIDVISSEHTVNFKFLCSLMSLDCEQRFESTDVFKAQGEKWFKLGLTNKDEAMTGLGLLTIRHVCSFSKTNFSNYANWLGTLSIKSTQDYAFLFKFLSQLVPYESPLFLKIHVTRVPPPPTSGQKSVSDYSSLAKTRLADLKESSEFMGLFNDFHESFQEQLKSDLNRLLKQFEDKREIPSALREAFMLRKQYYEKIFLPFLLSVPEAQDPLRGELIKKLQGAGKIPSSLYRSWKSS